MRQRKNRFQSNIYIEYIREEVKLIKSSSLIDYSKDEIRNLIIDIAPRARLF